MTGGRDVDDRLLALARAMSDLDHPVKKGVSAWAREHLDRRDLVVADHDLEFDRAGWSRLGERGLLGLLVGEEYGGAGDDLATTLLTLEGLGHGCRDNGLSYAAASQILSTQVALSRFGSGEQRERWLPGLVAGTAFAAFAITEADTGSDTFAMSARAERLPDGSYRIDADKAYITFAPIADVAIVFAVTQPDAGSWGVTAFVVPTDLPGVERSALRAKMGMRTTPFGDLRFDGVVVGPDAVLGREGAGARIFSAVLEVERSYVFATQVGAMQRQVDDVVEFAKRRTLGGEPIARLQAVAHRVVAMKERHERARLFLYRAAMAEVTGRDVALWSSLAKIVGGDVAIESALDASLLHGARGYVTEFEVERALRDAVGGLTYSGSSDVLRNVVARMLGL